MTSPPNTKIGLVQMGCGEDVTANIAKAENLIVEAASSGAQIICLQELFSTQYLCQCESQEPFALAVDFPGELSDRMAATAKRHGVVLIVPFFERRAPGVYHNTAAVIDADGAVLGIYRKMHIPDDPGFYEKYFFTPGDLGFRAWDTAFGKIGVCICWDQWFPEAARLTAMAGAEIIFYPTAIGWLPSEKEELGKAQHESWQVAQRAHGIANGCFIAATNRTGHEPDPSGGEGIEFWGQSFVSAPDGQVVGQLACDDEAVLVLEIDRAEVDRQRISWPFLRDRRIDAYGSLNQRLTD
ncbi:MAG: carbon-nitrogen hydrolase [Verrucomicrobiales bacterium]